MPVERANDNSGDQIGPRVGLFVTCIVDLLRPQIGFAALELLEASGCEVEVPEQQTCCGQPAFNSGDRADAVAIAKNVIEAFAPYDYVVAPSGSCAAMIKVHYPELFVDDPHWRDRAEELATRTWELSRFLVDVRAYRPETANRASSFTYHDSCSGHRELGVHPQPRALLKMAGHQLTEMKDSTECCGFGGTFCVKFTDISNAMVMDKANNARATGAEYLVGGDYGCLMNIAGKLNRQPNQRLNHKGSEIKVMHFAELLTSGAPGNDGERRWKRSPSI